MTGGVRDGKDKEKACALDDGITVEEFRRLPSRDRAPHGVVCRTGSGGDHRIRLPVPCPSACKPASRVSSDSGTKVRQTRPRRRPERFADRWPARVHRKAAAFPLAGRCLGADTAAEPKSSSSRPREHERGGQDAPACRGAVASRGRSTGIFGIARVNGSASSMRFLNSSLALATAPAQYRRRPEPVKPSRRKATRGTRRGPRNSPR